MNKVGTEENYVMRSCKVCTCNDVLFWW